MINQDFLTVLKERGFLYQATDWEGLQKIFSQKTVTAYIGFDATAPSLHVGSLVQIMMLRWLQKAGHRPIVLMGGGTSQIGDPTWKDTARPLMDAPTIASHIQSIQKIFQHYLDFEGPQGALLVDNAEWLCSLDYLKFLRDYGRFFSVNRLLTFDSMRLRLERQQPLSFLEFNYPLLQAFDFMTIHQKYGCSLQMGGADQWGNIVSGIDLIRRIHGKAVFGLTSPLITTSNGSKMGKTASGAIWLNPDQLSSYAFWQFWRNTSDADVPRYLKLFTEIPLDEVEKLSSLQGAELNEAKKILADSVTALAHGPEVLPEIHTTVQRVFERNGDSGRDSPLTPEILSSLPCLALPKDNLEKGVSLIDLLIHFGFSKSKGEARRLIQGRGVRVNGQPIENIDYLLHQDQCLPYAKISVGKKQHGLVKQEGRDEEGRCSNKF